MPRGYAVLEADREDGEQFLDSSAATTEPAYNTEQPPTLTDINNTTTTTNNNNNNKHHHRTPPAPSPLHGDQHRPPRGPPQPPSPVPLSDVLLSEDFRAADFASRSASPEGTGGGGAAESVAARRRRRRRDLAAFWILGLTNNFPYVIMLSAANDILQRIAPSQGTGVILLADILPTLVIKLSTPFLLLHLPYRLRVAAVVVFAAGSFVIEALAQSLAVALFGVVCASLSSGLGEITFLALTSQYHKNTVSAWSSGTGGAGAFGALSYLALTAGLSPKSTLWIMLLFPAAMAASYFFLLTSPVPDEDTIGLLPLDPDATSSDSDELLDNPSTLDAKHADPARLRPQPPLSFTDKVKRLLPFMLPLFLVYYAEYLINQGLYEHIWWQDIFISKATQYRVFQTLYQWGVFAARSSVNVLPVRRLWVPTALQWLNLFLLSLDARFQFIGSIWPVFVICLTEGVWGGLVYVNGFHGITIETPAPLREFSMSVASVADTFGIALSGASAIGYNALFKDAPGR